VDAYQEKMRHELEEIQKPFPLELSSDMNISLFAETLQFDN